MEVEIGYKLKIMQLPFRIVKEFNMSTFMLTLIKIMLHMKVLNNTVYKYKLKLYKFITFNFFRKNLKLKFTGAKSTYLKY